MIHGSRCASCALPLPAGGDALRCIDCQQDPAPLDWCDAWGRYGAGLDRLLHAFKFERHDFLDTPLASLLDALLLAHGDLQFDAIVPVPMSRAKERRRGYNQAELLARALARRAGIGCSLLLVRRDDRETQSLLDRDHRAANVRGAFTASPDVKGKSILIVDDICTTGETLRACAKELRRAGAVRVAAVAVAKAV
jgi:ComF family protein